MMGRLIYPSEYAYIPGITLWKGELIGQSFDQGMRMALRVST